MHLWSCTSIHFRLIRPVSQVLCSEFLGCRVIYLAKVQLQITLFYHLRVLHIFVYSTCILVLKVLEELFSVFLLNLLEVFLREASYWLDGLNILFYHNDSIFVTIIRRHTANIERFTFFGSWLRRNLGEVRIIPVWFLIYIYRSHCPKQSEMSMNHTRYDISIWFFLSFYKICEGLK